MRNGKGAAAMKIPQLRILATSFCDRQCVYCRPTGEGTPSCDSASFVDFSKALKICELYKKYGGNDIKISGGDPVFWPSIVNFISDLKNKLGIEKVELITRSPKVANIVYDLKNVGLDTLNFSLDVINAELYCLITGGNDYDELIETIRKCSSVLPVKINSVIMRGINYKYINELISFCEDNGIDQLKLLDVIDDLQGTNGGNSSRLSLLGVNKLNDLYVSLEELTLAISKRAISSSIVYQGGLGHPMNEYVMPSGLVVTFKNSENGAWYGDICKRCHRYPCHDALMALRYTPDNKLQLCLLNENASISLSEADDIEIEKKFYSALSIYNTATFYKGESI